MSKPLRFRSRQDLIVALRKCASAEALDYHLSAEERRPLKEVVHGWVSPNTFRAFHHCKRRPSEVLRECGTDTLGEEENLRRLSRVRSQEDYDEWHRNWCDSLLEYWGAEAGKPMPWGPSRKLPNLLMKGLLSDYRDCI